VLTDARQSFFCIGEIIMNRFGKLICVLGLAMAFASVAFAQSVAQSAMKMDAGCCCSDSCDMTTKDAMKNHVMSSAKAGCCACCGDSCDMKQMKNHAAADKGSCCACCGDSCDMKKKDAMKNHASASDKDGCCACCGDSCDMKKKDAMKNHATSSDKHEGCCCGDSCDMKSMKDVKKL